MIHECLILRQATVDEEDVSSAWLFRDELAEAFSNGAEEITEGVHQFIELAKSATPLFKSLVSRFSDLINSAVGYASKLSAKLRESSSAAPLDAKRDVKEMESKLMKIRNGLRDMRDNRNREIVNIGPDFKNSTFKNFHSTELNQLEKELHEVEKFHMKPYSQKNNGHSTIPSKNTATLLNSLWDECYCLLMELYDNSIFDF